MTALNSQLPTPRTMAPKILLAITLAVGCGSLRAQTNVWQPSPGRMQVPIWPGAIPDAQPVPGPEAVLHNTNWVVAGKPFAFVVNVSTPTMTVYPPRGTNT